MLMNLTSYLSIRNTTELSEKLARVPGNSEGTCPLGQLLYLPEVTFMSGEGCLKFTGCEPQWVHESMPWAAPQQGEVKAHSSQGGERLKTAHSHIILLKSWKETSNISGIDQ